MNSFDLYKEMMKLDSNMKICFITGYEAMRPGKFDSHLAIESDLCYSSSVVQYYLSIHILN
jgi:hypothetical protein